MKKYQQYLLCIAIIAIFTLNKCAYFNTFYNAEQYFKKGLELRERNKTGKQTSQEIQNFDKAIEKSYKVLSDYPDSKYVDDAIFLIAKSYFYKREYGQAQKRFEEIVYNFPQSPFVSESRVWIARCLFETGNDREAMVELRSALKTLKDKRLLSGTHYFLAEMMLKNGEFDSAMIHMKKVLDISWDDAEKAQTVYRIAEINYERRKYDEATKFLNKIYSYKITPELNEKAQVLYAKIYASSRNFEEARKLINKMLADEKNKDVWPILELELAKIYEEENNYTRALSRYKSITENYQRTAESAEAYYRMGLIHIYHEIDYEAARNEFENVPKEYRDSPYSVESRQRKTELDRYLSLKKEMKEIEDKIAQLEQIKVDSESGLNQLQDSVNAQADVTEELSQLRQAFELKSQLDETNQDTSRVYQEYYDKIYQLGELLFFNLNQPDSSILMFQKLTEDLPYSDMQPQALYMLYYIYQVRKDSLLSESIKTNLINNYPNSKYTLLLTDKVISDSTQINEAEKLYYEAEKNMHMQPLLSLSLFDSIRLKFPEEETSEKALYTKAFIYDEILLDTSLAMLTYKEFLNRYPGSELSGIVTQRLDFLKNLNTTIDDSVKGVDEESMIKENADKPKEAEKEVLEP